MDVSTVKIVITEPDRLANTVIDHLAPFGTIVQGPFTPAQLRRELADADAMMVRLAHRIDADLLAEAKQLKVVASATTGHTHIDESYLVNRKIKLVSLRGETEFLRQITATAELTWGLILALARRFPEISTAVSAGEWDRDAVRGTQLKGTVLGIVGCGRLGSIVAEYGAAFRMKVLAHDPHVETFPDHVEAVGLDHLLSRSDFVTIHVPADATTRGLIGDAELRSMKPSAFLINTSRGEVLDEEALINALRENRIAGAGLDTIQDERGPLEGWLPSRAVWQYSEARHNLILTPHVGGATDASMAEAETFVAGKLADTLKAMA